MSSSTALLQRFSASQDGRPCSVLPVSQVVKFLVPRHVQDDLVTAGALDESMVDRVADKLHGKTVRELLPAEPQELPVVNHDDTIVEVAALMARLRCPLVVVMREETLIGVITVARLLEVTLAPH